MTDLTILLLVYLFGGLTLLPSLAALILLYAHLTFPKTVPKSDRDGKEKDGASGRPRADQHEDTRDVFDSFPEELKSKLHEPDAAAGYFAVTREYVPGGVSGKPLERTTPAGTVAAQEQPTVYQNMYRSIFTRNKNERPKVENGKANVKQTKRPPNLFYVVLRHAHLMLYDDEEQMEVRHVIALASYDVDIFSGSDDLPEGELFIKRNCIRLRRKKVGDDVHTEPRPFFLFSDSASQKEDFYFALLQNQEEIEGAPPSLPKTRKFEAQHMVELVRQLHASEENIQTRWFNALIGRLFLALYQTPDLEEFISNKITRKISRVQKPSFVSSIKLQSITTGESAPMITNPKLRELTLDGDLTIEADVKYAGNFKIELSSIARLELGQRIKAREIAILVATTLKRLEGHLLVRMKPPPSCRLWISFETMPKMDLAIEPVVSTRQITWGFILRTVESRIREVVAETLVYPNWDDTPFFNTKNQRYRAGIWEDDTNVKPMSSHARAESEHPTQEEKTDMVEPDAFPTPDPSEAFSTNELERSQSISALPDTPTPLTSRKGSGPASHDSGSERASSISTGADVKPSPGKPIAMRSHSFATPVVSVDPANADATNALQAASTTQPDAARAMKSLSQRSSEAASPSDSPVGSPPAYTPSHPAQPPPLPARTASLSTASDRTSSTPSLSSSPSRAASLLSGPAAPAAPSITSAPRHAASEPLQAPLQHSISTSSSSSSSSNPSPSLTPSVPIAVPPSASPPPTRWSWTHLGRSAAAAATPPPSLIPKLARPPSTSALAASRAAPSPAPPLGRGFPLPPPGVPLPLPGKGVETGALKGEAAGSGSLMASSAAAVAVGAGGAPPLSSAGRAGIAAAMARKALPRGGAMAGAGAGAGAGLNGKGVSPERMSMPPPLPPRAKSGDEVFVVRAPRETGARDQDGVDEREQQEEEGEEGDGKGAGESGATSESEAWEAFQQNVVDGKGEAERADDGGGKLGMSGAEERG